jgi:hypothetical protein
MVAATLVAYKLHGPTFTKNVVQLYVQPMLFYYMQTQLVSVNVPKKNVQGKHQLWGVVSVDSLDAKKNRMTSRRNLGMGQPWDNSNHKLITC